MAPLNTCKPPMLGALMKILITDAALILAPLHVLVATALKHNPGLNQRFIYKILPGECNTPMVGLTMKYPFKDGLI